MDSTPQLAIDPTRCRKDGLCAQVCPARVFHFEPGQVPTIERPELCVICGQCLAVCPGEAIAHSELDPADFAPIVDAHPVSAPAMDGFIRQRRSIRSYRSKPPARALLEEVARAAAHAPTGAFGGAGRVRRVTVVSGEEPMRALRETTIAYLRQLERTLGGFMVPLVARFNAEARGGLTALPDLRMRLAEWSEGRDSLTYDAPAAIFVSTTHATATPHEDCDAALMNVMFSAHAHGLGTCWNGWLGHAALGEHVRGPSALGALLDLPDDTVVVEALTIGHPRLRLRRVPPREVDLRWVGPDQ